MAVHTLGIRSMLELINECRRNVGEERKRNDDDENHGQRYRVEAPGRNASHQPRQEYEKTAKESVIDIGGAGGDADGHVPCHPWHRRTNNQFPRTNLQTDRGGLILEFGVWSLIGIWFLVLEISLRAVLVNSKSEHDEKRHEETGGQEGVRLAAHEVIGHESK